MRAPKPPAYFFKFIPPGPKCQLSLPKSFTKHLKSRQNKNTAILRRGCKKWLVKIVDSWVFGEGWEIFVRDNGIQDFDFVVFKHERNMVFDTMVFDSSCCEREYPSKKAMIMEADKTCPEAKSLHNPKIVKRTGSIVDVPARKARRQRCGLDPRADTSEIGGPKIRSKRVKSDAQAERDGSRLVNKSMNSVIKTEEPVIPDHNHHRCFVGNKLIRCPSEAELEAPRTGRKGVKSSAQAERDGSNTINKSMQSVVKVEGSRITDQNHHPYVIGNNLFHHGMVKSEVLDSRRSFVGTLQSFGNSRSCLYLPKKFALSNGLSSGEMILKTVENEGSWTVFLKDYFGKYFVQRGWREFSVANGFVSGDKFRFELIQNEQKPVAYISRISMETRKKMETRKMKETPSAEAAHHPCYKSIATPYAIKNSVMTVPMAFARSNGLHNRNCDVVVMDEKRRLWPVILRHIDGRVCLRGVRGMMLANGLKIGTEYLFELVDNGKKPRMNFRSNLSRSL